MSNTYQKRQRGARTAHPALTNSKDVKKKGPSRVQLVCNFIGLIAVIAAMSLSLQGVYGGERSPSWYSLAVALFSIAAAWIVLTPKYCVVDDQSRRAGPHARARMEQQRHRIKA